MPRRNIIFFMIMSQIIYGVFALYAIGAIVATLMTVAASPPSLIGYLFVASSICYPIIFLLSLIAPWLLFYWAHEPLAFKIAQLPALVLMVFVVSFILFFWG